MLRLNEPGFEFEYVMRVSRGRSTTIILTSPKQPFTTVETTFPSTAMSSDSNPSHALKCLQRYARHQENLIQSLLQSEDDTLRRTTLKRWEELHSSAWGKDPDSLDETEPVIRGPDPIDNQSLLPDVVPSSRSVMSKPATLDNCWNLRAKKYLIRSEYKEVEEYVLSTSGSAPGVVVTGRPGIGLSLFCAASTRS